MIKSAEVFHGTCRVPVGAILQYIVQTVVEYNGIFNAGHGLANNAGLAQGHPILESAFDDQPLGRHLGNSIVVKHARLDRVSHPAPMDRRHPVSGFRHGTNINKAGFILLPQCINGVDQIPGRAIVDLHGLLGVIVCRGRNKSGNVQNQITVPDTLQNHVIVVQIAPDDL